MLQKYNKFRLCNKCLKIFFAIRKKYLSVGNSCENPMQLSVTFAISRFDHGYWARRSVNLVSFVISMILRFLRRTHAMLFGGCHNVTALQSTFLRKNAT